MADVDSRGDGESTGDQKRIQELSIKFLDYLSAVAREITSKPRRDYHTDSQALLWDDCVNPSSYVLWGPRASSGAHGAWLTVKKADNPQPPEVTGELGKYIDSSSIVSDTTKPKLDDVELERHRTVLNAEVKKNFSRSKVGSTVSEEELGIATPVNEQPADGEQLGGKQLSVQDQIDLNKAQNDTYDEFVEDIQGQLDKWVSTVWKPWLENNQSVFEARRLYNELYDLHLKYASMTDSQELVWGNAVIYYDAGDQTTDGAEEGERIHMCYPLLITPVNIQLDIITGALSIVPDSATVLNLNVFDGLGLGGLEGLTLLQNELRQGDRDIDIWDDDNRHALEQAIVAPLGVDARVVDRNDVPHPCLNPMVTDESVLVLRDRPKREHEFYTNLSREIRETGFLPEALDSLIVDNDTISKAVGNSMGDCANQGSRPEGSDVEGYWSDDDGGDRIWMPLPSNEEQRRIATELTHNSGVTVQGPPGTGKTHTIANLVSHLLAHGQRVLVTAEKDQALNVLRDKIPEQIRDLTMAVTGSSPASIEKLKDSAQSMQDKLSSVDLQADSAKVVEFERQIDELEDESRRCDVELEQALAVERSEFDIPSGTARAVDVARWVGQNGALDIISDDIEQDVSFPLSVADFREFVDLCRSISPEEASASAFEQDLAEGFPGGDEIDHLFSAAAMLGETVASLDDDGLNLDALDNCNDDQIDTLIHDAEMVLRHGELVNGDLCEMLFTGNSHSASELAWLRAANRSIADDARLGVDLEQPLLGHHFVVPAGQELIQKPLLEEWSRRLAAGKKLGIFASKQLKEFAAGVTVDGYQPVSVEQLGLTAAFIHARELWSGAARKARDVYARFGMGSPDPSGAQDFLSLLNAVQSIEDVYIWWSDEREPLDRRLSSVVRFDHPAYSPATLHTAIELLRRASDRRKQQDVEQRIKLIGEVCDQAISNDPGNMLWPEFKQALIARNAGRWNSAYHRLLELLAVHEHCVRRDALGTKIGQAGAVAWKERLVACRGDAKAYGSLDTLESSWRIAQAKTWLRRLHDGPSVESLMKHSTEVSKDLSRVTVELIRLSSLVHLKSGTRDKERRALAGWLQAIKKVGKGTGKNAPRYRAQAQALLPEALGAVPVWIMPIYRVFENFVPGASRPFDVVIVDESSQCDLLTVGVLALAKKAIVVGDDKQTSPNRVGIDTSRIFDLQRRYLDDVPDKALFSVEASLYALADRAFKNTILLREHYRCVPEIIEYSNRFYNGQIKPLRECTRPQIGSPLRAVHVNDGVSRKQGSSRINMVEAQRIADLISRCVKDPNYDGMTFGVVTMMSGKQRDVIYTAVQNALDSAEIEKREIRVGNPPDFQGDERDVIILSMVADDHSFAATSEAYMQWANVAVSRARDQLWVFYSMDYMSLNSNDVRRGIIEYVENFHYEQNASDLFELTESKFEEDVLRDMLRRGYKVEPQHRIGRYRIDFVVDVAPGFRLAIECDGDSYHGSDKLADDIRRQRDLERLGWNFWRIRASQYYLDPEESMQPLWSRLEDLRQRAHSSGFVQPNPIGAADIGTEDGAAEDIDSEDIETENGDVDMRFGFSTGSAEKVDLVSASPTKRSHSVSVERGLGESISADDGHKGRGRHARVVSDD